MGIKNVKSFTLIELIIAVGVVGLVLPSIFNIFFTMIRQQLILVAYQEMKQQGDSARKNIKNIVQERAAYITDATYTSTNECPLIPLPTPTYAPALYMFDRDIQIMSLYKRVVAEVDTIASSSGARITPYNLTSENVKVTDLGFSCYKINEFTPSIVSIKYTIQKATVFKEMSLPYAFTVRLRNY